MFQILNYANQIKLMYSIAKNKKNVI